MPDELDRRLDEALASHSAKKRTAEEERVAEDARRDANADEWQRICDSVVAPALESIAGALRERGLEAVATNAPGAVELAFLPADSPDTLEHVTSMNLPRIRFHIRDADPGFVSVDQSTMTRNHGGSSGKIARLSFDQVTHEAVTELATALAEEVLSR